MQLQIVSTDKEKQEKQTGMEFVLTGAVLQ
jgi:hypothetical protein